MNKPEIYRRSGPTENYAESAERTKRKRFYQGKPWRTLRARMLSKAQKEDPIEVTRIYNANKEIPFTDLQLYSTQSPMKPFCRQCIEQNRIHSATTLDHIVAIADGGKPLDPDNLQWLCDHHHQSKSAKERHGRG